MESGFDIQANRWAVIYGQVYAAAIGKGLLPPVARRMAETAVEDWVAYSNAKRV